MPSIAKRDNGKWRARYRDEGGKEHARHFPRKVDAQRWLDEVTASLVTGQYVDPNAGKITFRKFYAAWSARQIWVASTRDNASTIFLPPNPKLLINARSRCAARPFPET